MRFAMHSGNRSTPAHVATEVRFDGFMHHGNNPHVMERDSPPVDATGEIMAAIEDEGGAERLVIADVTTDGSWLSAPTDASVSVAEAR